MTYNRTISTFQERLVVDVNDCRQQILQSKHNSHFHELNKCNSDNETISSLNTPNNAMSERLTYRKRLARASLCNADHIIAAKSQRPALSLDGCWFTPVLFVDYIHHIGWRKVDNNWSRCTKTFFEMLFIQMFKNLQGKLASWNFWIGFGGSD